MTPEQIENTYLEIRQQVKNGEIRRAAGRLEQVLADLGDNKELDKLDDELMTLISRFNRLEKERLMGMIEDEDAKKEQDGLVNRLSALLKQVKQLALTITE